MDVEPREIQVARSFLDDIMPIVEYYENLTMTSVAEVSIGWLHSANVAMKDINLAISQLNQIEDTEAVRVIWAELKLSQARLDYANSRHFMWAEQRQYISSACEALTESIMKYPTAVAYFLMGRCYSMINDSEKAIKCWQYAEKMGDEIYGIAATKEILRLQAG